MAEGSHLEFFSNCSNLAVHCPTLLKFVEWRHMGPQSRSCVETETGVL